MDKLILFLIIYGVGFCVLRMWRNLNTIFDATLRKLDIEDKSKNKNEE